MVMSVRSTAKVVLIVAGVAVAAAVVMRLRQRHEVVTDAADAIRSQLDDLDPVAKAAVRARLVGDVVAEHKRR